MVRRSSAVSSQMDEQCVIDNGCTLNDLGIVLRHLIAEALADRP